MQIKNLSINGGESTTPGAPPSPPNGAGGEEEEEEDLGIKSEAQSNSDDDGDLEVDAEGRKNKSSRKPYKELLTEEEKRANHIASEQKRRNTIRAGFKELTDIIPTLKNVNNSKSTILFKAVDYIKYLERRNRNLKERAGVLEMRVEMEMWNGKRIPGGHQMYSMGYGRGGITTVGMINGYAVSPTHTHGHHRSNSGMSTPTGGYFSPQQQAQAQQQAAQMLAVQQAAYRNGLVSPHTPGAGPHTPGMPPNSASAMNIPMEGCEGDHNAHATGYLDLEGDSSMSMGVATVRGAGAVKC